MQVTVEDISSVKKTLHVEIPREDVVREIDKAYDEIKKSAKIKGFRPGKVPRSVLEKMFRKDVLADVSSRLIQSSFIDAVKEKDLRVVGRPQLDPPEIDISQPYKYAATVEVTPPIADIDLKGMQLKRSVYAVSETEVDAQLKMLQKNLARLEKIADNRPVSDGDHLLVDFEGFKDGRPFAGTPKTENFTLKVGAGAVLACEPCGGEPASCFFDTVMSLGRMPMVKSVSALSPAAPLSVSRIAQASAPPSATAMKPRSCANRSTSLRGGTAKPILNLRGR